MENITIGGRTIDCCRAKTRIPNEMDMIERFSLQKMLEVTKKRNPIHLWNVYRYNAIKTKRKLFKNKILV